MTIIIRDPSLSYLRPSLWDGGRKRKWAFPVAVTAIALTSFAVAIADSQLVIWANKINVGSTGDVLQKIAGCDGCDDAGATSQQTVPSGDGFVEFTVGESNTLWAAGLSSGNSDATYADIDFAFRFNGGGWAESSKTASINLAEIHRTRPAMSFACPWPVRRFSAAATA